MAAWRLVFAVPAFARVERRKMAERTIFLHSDVCRSRPSTFLEPAAGKVQKEYRAVTAS